MVFRETQFTNIRVRSVGLGWYRWDGGRHMIVRSKKARYLINH
jgi:hypothetical protein